MKDWLKRDYILSPFAMGSQAVALTPPRVYSGGVFVLAPEFSLSRSSARQSVGSTLEVLPDKAGSQTQKQGTNHQQSGNSAGGDRSEVLHVGIGRAEKDSTDVHADHYEAQ